MNIRKALGYSIVSKYLNRAVSLISIVLIARLLTPEELGVFSIASAIALIISEFKSFGVGSYLIRSEVIDKNLVARALGLNGLISWTAGIVLVLSAWTIEDFYDKPDIGILIQILSVSFFLNPHVSVVKSLLERQFSFDKVLLIDISVSLSVFASTMIFIYLDFSYFSLALGTSIGFIVEFILILIFRPEHFAFFPKFNNLKPLASFGVYVTFSQFFKVLSKSAPELIIGKLGSTAQVAYFSRALGLISFINMTIASGIRPVVVPYLSQKVREGNDVGQAYLFATQLLCCIVVPILAVISYASDSIVIFMFGDQWYESTGILSILGVAFMVNIIHAFSPQLLVATKSEKIMFYKDAFMLIVTFSLAVSLFPYGLEAIAFGVVFSASFNCLVLSTILRVKLKIGFRRQLVSFIPNIILTSICLGWAVFFDHFVISLDASRPFIEVASLGFSSAVVWLGTIFLIKHPLRDEVLNILEKVFGFLKKP